MRSLLLIASIISVLQVRAFQSSSRLPLRIVKGSIRKMSSNELPTTPEGWKTVLSPSQFKVLRQQATEPPGFSENTPGKNAFYQE